MDGDRGALVVSRGLPLLEGLHERDSACGVRWRQLNVLSCGRAESKTSRQKESREQESTENRGDGMHRAMKDVVATGGATLCLAKEDGAGILRKEVGIAREMLFLRGSIKDFEKKTSVSG